MYLVIKSLVDLYERLLAQGLVAPHGWDQVKIGYKIILTIDGSVKKIVDVREKVTRGKKTALAPQLMVLPKAVVRTNGYKANFLWDKASYVFGYDKESPDKAEFCFREMRRKHHLILDACKSMCAKALLAFFDTWNAHDTSFIESNREVLEGISNFCFAVDDGKKILPVADDVEIRKAWSEYLDSLSKSDEAVYGICSVTGKEHQKLALIHPKIKGIAGSDSSGSCLVCYNVKSVCSWGYDGQQAVNSFISEYAASAYTKALNWLLASPHHHTVFDNVTVVYWSAVNDEQYNRCFEQAMNHSIYPNEEKEETVDFDSEKLHEVFRDLMNGESFLSENGEICPDETFYILGLGSSGSRASVRFFMKNTFGGLLKNICIHQEQMMIDRPDTVHSIPLWMMLKATVRKGGSVPSPLVDSVFKSILYHTQYPTSLYRNVLQRVYLEADNKTGKDKTYKINYIKAGIIKAWLLRNGKGQWEDLNSVSVNTECKKKPYLLGRLFALLEGIQTSALPGINTTIKDRFFNSACRTPAVIFPILLRLSQAHRKKLAKGLSIYFDKKVSELVDRIAVNVDGTGFPVRLTPEEQGAFMLGYYQERQSVFNKKKTREEVREVKAEEPKI